MSTPIFTPDNEPYLGREPLFVFDTLVSSCLDVNSKCAPASRIGSLSRFQHALCILVPQTITLALSVRELIRQGYLFGAKVLVRPLAERAITIYYLYKSPQAQEVWDDGWRHNRRPKLQEMIEYLNELHPQPIASLKGALHGLNSVTHGDPMSARWNVLVRDDGTPVFPVSKNLHSPRLADEICEDVIPWLSVTAAIMNAAFGHGPSEANGPK